MLSLLEDLVLSRSLKSFGFVQALQTPDGLRWSEALAIHGAFVLGQHLSFGEVIHTRAAFRVGFSLEHTVFQSTTLSPWAGSCLSESPRQGEGGHAGDSCGTPPANADSGNHQAASVPSTSTGLAQLGNPDIHKTIKVGNVFRHYLPVRAEACLASR